jgi:hypothetical protein
LAIHLSLVSSKKTPPSGKRGRNVCAKVIMALALVTAVVTGVDPGAIFASVHAINVVLKHNRDIAEGIPSAE